MTPPGEETYERQRYHPHTNSNKSTCISYCIYTQTPSLSSSSPTLPSLITFFLLPFTLLIRRASSCLPPLTHSHSQRVTIIAFLFTQPLYIHTFLAHQYPVLYIHNSGGRFMSRYWRPNDFSKRCHKTNRNPLLVTLSSFVCWHIVFAVQIVSFP